MPSGARRARRGSRGAGAPARATPAPGARPCRRRAAGAAAAPTAAGSRPKKPGSSSRLGVAPGERVSDTCQRSTKPVNVEKQYSGAMNARIAIIDQLSRKRYTYNNRHTQLSVALPTFASRYAPSPVFRRCGSGSSPRHPHQRLEATLHRLDATLGGFGGASSSGSAFAAR